MSRLEELVAGVRETVARRRADIPPETLRERIGTRTGSRPFNEALVRTGLSLIAEFKRSSPSAGEIRADADLAGTVAAYERGGAAALSILTEERQFGGSLEDLREAREGCSLPILRKDFTVDVYQLYEAAASGADAVLLVVAALEDVEVIGINNRNLRDLTLDLATTQELMTDVPAGKTVVAESGYETREQLEELERIGADAVLIGETLMRAEDPEAAVRELILDEETTREHPV